MLFKKEKAVRIVLIRHGETDYSQCLKKDFFGLGLNLAPLTKTGCKQAYDISKEAILNGAQLIVSSPYTRALQTASIISRERNLPIEIEMDLHEWLPDIKYMNKFEEEEDISKDFFAHEGFWPEKDKKRWEAIDMLSNRVFKALKKYSNYKKIIVVSHAVVLYHLLGIDTVPYCCVAEIEFDDNFIPKGWFYKNR